MGAPAGPRCPEPAHRCRCRSPTRTGPWCLTAPVPPAAALPPSRPGAFYRRPRLRVLPAGPGRAGLGAAAGQSRVLSRGRQGDGGGTRGSLHPRPSGAAQPGDRGCGRSAPQPPGPWVPARVRGERLPGALSGCTSAGSGRRELVQNHRARFRPAEGTTELLSARAGSPAPASLLSQVLPCSSSERPYVCLKGYPTACKTIEQRETLPPQRRPSLTIGSSLGLMLSSQFFMRGALK